VLWVAVVRAPETDRPEALFRDPFARRLAGTQGEQIAQKMGSLAALLRGLLWSALVPDVISAQIRAGADKVVNLAAGLDARLYRMNLPPSLKGVDLPATLDYKEEIIAGACVYFPSPESLTARLLVGIESRG
jgi:O-methyltransferase involved in polyketide biosynthesis